MEGRRKATYIWQGVGGISKKAAVGGGAVVRGWGGGGVGLSKLDKCVGQEGCDRSRTTQNEGGKKSGDTRLRSMKQAKE